MNNREENAKVVLEAIEDLFKKKAEKYFTGEEELSHMTGDFELCGKTADEVIRKMNEDRRNENNN